MNGPKYNIRLNAKGWMDQYDAIFDRLNFIRSEAAWSLHDQMRIAVGLGTGLDAVVAAYNEAVAAEVMDA